MENLRHTIHPGLRGALFYGTLWGAVGMVEPFFNVYFLRSGMTRQQIGWLAAVLPLCVMVIAPIISRQADRFHRRVRFLAAACLGYGLAIILPGLAGPRPSFGLLVGLVALFAVFRSPIVSLGDSLITGMASRHALDFGGMRLWGSIIFTLTASLLGLLWERTGFQVMFLAAGISFLLVIFAVMLLEESPRQGRPTTTAQTASPIDRYDAPKPADPLAADHPADLFDTPDGVYQPARSNPARRAAPIPAPRSEPLPALHAPASQAPAYQADASQADAARAPQSPMSALQAKDSQANAANPATANAKPSAIDPGLLFLLAATFLIVAALFMSSVFGAVYMTELGGPPVLVGAMMGLAALGEVPGMLFGARAARRIGDTNTLVIAYLVCAAGLAGYALIRVPWLLAVFSVVRGLGFGLMLVSTVPAISKRAPHALAATYQGLMNALCWGLAPLLGGPISGWIYQNYGPAALFTSAAAMALLAIGTISPTYRLWGHTRGGI